MTAIRATRTPQGAPYTTGSGPESIRHRANAPWPGITGPFDARCWACTWATHNGIYQIKHPSPVCEVPEHRRVSGG